MVLLNFSNNVYHGLNFISNRLFQVFPKGINEEYKDYLSVAMVLSPEYSRPGIIGSWMVSVGLSSEGNSSDVEYRIGEADHRPKSILRSFLFDERNNIVINNSLTLLARVKRYKFIYLITNIRNFFISRFKQMFQDLTWSHRTLRQIFHYNLDLDKEHLLISLLIFKTNQSEPTSSIWLKAVIFSIKNCLRMKKLIFLKFRKIWIWKLLTKWSTFCMRTKSMI